MLEWLEWSVLRDVCQGLMGLLGVIMACYDIWTRKYKPFVIFLFFILAVGSIVAGRENDNESARTLASSQSKLADALRDLADRSKEMIDIEKDNLALQKENFALQKGVVAQAKIEKDAQNKLRMTVLVPLEKLIDRGEIELRSMLGSMELDSSHYRSIAGKWAKDVREFLSSRCSDKEVAEFIFPFDEIRPSGSEEHWLKNHQEIMKFYKTRMEYLRKLHASPAGCSR